MHNKDSDKDWARTESYREAYGGILNHKQMFQGTRLVGYSVKSGPQHILMGGRSSGKSLLFLQEMQDIADLEQSVLDKWKLFADYEKLKGHEADEEATIKAAAETQFKDMNGNGRRKKTGFNLKRNAGNKYEASMGKGKTRRW